MRRPLVSLLTTGLLTLALVGTSDRAQADPPSLIDAIEAAGAHGRAANRGPTALAVLTANLGVTAVQELAREANAGRLDTATKKALQDNGFLPPEGMGQAVTGLLRGGEITDRLTGQTLKVYAGSPPFRAGDLFGLDNRVVTLRGELREVDGQPAIVYDEMAPGESHSFINGRMVPPSQYPVGLRDHGVLIRGGSNRWIVIKNPRLAALLEQYRSNDYGGVGIIVPGQIKAVTKPDQSVSHYELHTGGDTGVPAIPDGWILTDIYGNNYGRFPLNRNGKYLYVAEVYDRNKILVTVGGAFPNQRARHMAHGQLVETFGEFSRQTGVRNKAYTADPNGPYQGTAGDSFNPAPDSDLAANLQRRRFFIADAVTPDLSEYNYVTTVPYNAGNNAPRIAPSSFTDPGLFRGFGADDTRSATGVSSGVQQVLDGFNRQSK